MPTRRQRQSYQSRIIMNWKTQEIQRVNTLSNKVEKEKKKNNHSNQQHNNQR